MSDFGGPVSVAMVSPGCRTSQAADVVYLGPGYGLAPDQLLPGFGDGVRSRRGITRL